MTGFDYVAIGIVGVSLIFGLWRGVVGEIIALVAWVLAIFAAVEFGAVVGRTAFAGLADPALRTLAGCVVIFVGVLVVMALFRMAVRSMVKALGLSVSDRILGMVFGLGPWRAGVHGAGRTGGDDLGADAGLVAGCDLVGTFGNRRLGHQTLVAGRLGKTNSI